MSTEPEAVSQFLSLNASRQRPIALETQEEAQKKDEERN